MRRALVVALAVGAAFAVAAVLAALDDPSGFRNSDGRSFEHVASNPFGDGRVLADDPFVDGTAYRMGRVLYPLLAWVLAAGQSGLVLTTLVVVAVAGFAASVFVAAVLAQMRGRPAVLGVVVVCTPFAIRWLFQPWAVAEPLVLALLLGVAWAYMTDRRSLAIGLLALAILGRESVAVVLVPLLWIEWRRVGARNAARWLLALVPYAAWVAWLGLRVGTLPFLDPAPSRRGALGWPLMPMVDVVTAPFGTWQGLAILAGVVTLVVAVFVALRSSWTPVTQMGLALSAVVACFGPSVWGLWGEALRVMAPAQALVLLALAVGVSGRG